NNDLIIYTNAATDPYTEGSNGAMINENQTNLDAVIGSGNYDIGHVFSQLLAGSVGLASLNSVCRTGSKARGVSATFAPIGDGFVLPAVAHEMGHQFGATHSFNTNTTLNNCAPNRTGGTAWEPGAGSTLMSYAGACPPHNYTNGADDYYHGGNQAQIIDYTRNGLGNSCPVIINTGNQDPVVTVPDGGFFIPLSTPFALDGGGMDADGDSLTYSWEQMDLGPAGDPNLPLGNAPLFRSFPATPETGRIFPNINRIVTNTQIIGEILPDYARDMNFRLTVRDQNGGVSQEDLAFEVAGNSGPFLVTYPSDQLNAPLIGGTYIEVQWDVANTNLIPVNCQTVNVHLSTDGGFTYPISLAEQVPNSGSAWVILPEIDDTQCRIRVEADDNIFFDISNENFAIETAGQPTVDMVQVNGPAVLCPGSETSLTFFTTGLLGFADSVSWSAPSLVPGLTGVFQPEVFAPGDTIVFQLSGTDSLAAATYPITLLASSLDGTVNEVFNYFLEVIPPIIVPEPVALTPIDFAAQSVDDVGFAWEALVEAETYEIEVATEPTFGASQIYLADGLAVANAQLPFSLTPFSIYYWRVRGENACGEGEWGEVEAFQTGSCAETISPNVPVNIPVFGNPATVSSTVVVASTDPIEAIKVVNLTGTHSSINDLEMSLTSPNNTTVELFSEICTDFDINFSFNFADGGATIIDCPPTTGQTLAPLEPLSAFEGENPLGIWSLNVRDISNFEGGELQNWGLEICTNGLDRPELITNAGLQTDRWNLETLETSLLEATDASGAPANLLFTVIQLPRNGGLLLDGTNLAIGDVFSQADVDANLLSYLHNGSLTEADSFRFDLRNQVGGWNGVYTFTIDITKSTSKDELLQGELTVFPNPAGDWLEVQGADLPIGAVRLTLYNLQGQLLLQQVETVGSAGLNARLNVAELSAGIYVLRATSEAGMWMQRVLKD
ncbi:MAG: reprolysin-like metallopeptidase, partial [Bacteroidota bacterium]